jgi:hypothetical protein
MAERAALEERALTLGDEQAARFLGQMRGEILVGQPSPLPKPLNRVNGLFTIHRITVVPAGSFSPGDEKWSSF